VVVFGINVATYSGSGIAVHHTRSWGLTIIGTENRSKGCCPGAVARIRFGSSESLLGVITSEVGVGKAVALRAATTQLDPSAHFAIYAATMTRD
jgi:hypothetical protein